MKILLLSTLFASASLCNAQSLQTNVHEFTAQRVNQMSVYSKAIKPFEAVAAQAPKKAVEDGVFYHRPEGLYYSGYRFGSAGDMSAMLAPALKEITFLNGCLNAADATWSINGNDLSDYTDFDNNLVISYSAASDEEYYYNPMYAPTISADDIDFSITDLVMTAREATPALALNPVLVTNYTGFSDGPGFGSNSVLEAALCNQIEGAQVVSYTNIFQKPISPMYVTSFAAQFWSESEEPFAGKTLTATIYRIDDEGQISDTPEHVLTCSGDDELTYYESNNMYVGMATFAQVEVNEFGDEETAPFVIDYPFAVTVEGYAQDGVDIRFLLNDAADDLFEFQYAEPTYLDTYVNGELRRYKFQGSVAEGRDANWCYTYPLMINALYDGIEVVAQDNYNALVVSNDGETVSTYDKSGDNALSYALVYTALPFFEKDEDGNIVGENYGLEGCPDWLTFEADDSVWSNADYGYNALFPVCEALPAGVTSRRADVYVVSDKGVKSEKPIIVVQGDLSGIQNVETSKNANVMYNVAGQRVNNANGVVIMNNKKVLVK